MRICPLVKGGVCQQFTPLDQAIPPQLAASSPDGPMQFDVLDQPRTVEEDRRCEALPHDLAGEHIEVRKLAAEVFERADCLHQLAEERHADPSQHAEQRQHQHGPDDEPRPPGHAYASPAAS